MDFVQSLLFGRICGIRSPNQILVSLTQLKICLPDSLRYIYMGNKPFPFGPIAVFIIGKAGDFP